MLKKHFITVKIFLAVMLPGLSACKEQVGGELREGEIEFELQVIDKKHPLASMAPSSATLRFKGDKSLLEMSTMGVFKTIFISDIRKKTLTQMVKFMNIKQACIETEKDILEENSGYRLKTEETGETKVIAGYSCRRVRVSLIDNPSVVFDAFYTNDLGHDNLNALTPYAGIKGMLMQYRLKRLGLELQFTAKNVKGSPVPDHSFELPPYFKVISKKEMQDFFAEYL